jgi:hypothetical protein
MVAAATDRPINSEGPIATTVAVIASPSTLIASSDPISIEFLSMFLGGIELLPNETSVSTAAQSSASYKSNNGG